MLAIIEVADGLSGLEGRVRVPHSTSFLHDLLLGILVGGIGRDDVLNGASLNTNHTYWDTTKTSATDDDSLCPAGQRFFKGVLVEETGQEALFVVFTGNEPADVVRLLLRREVGDRAVPWVRSHTDGNWIVLLVRNEGEPIDDLFNPLEIVGCRHVGDTVPVHDLGATELEIRGVDFATEQIVDCSGTR